MKNHLSGSSTATMDGGVFAGNAVKIPRKTLSLSPQMLADCLALYDALAIFMSGIGAQYIYLAFSKGQLSSQLNYLALMSTVAVAFHFIARQHDLYSVSKATNFAGQLSSLIYVCLITFALAFMILFFLKISDLFSRVWFAQWSVLLLVFLALGRGLLVRRFDSLAKRGSLKRAVVLIGCGQQFQETAARLRQDQRDFQLVAAFETLKAEAVTEDLFRCVRDCSVDEIIISVPAHEASAIGNIVRHVQTLPVDVHILPDFGGVKLPFMKLRQAGEFAFITTVSKPIDGWKAFYKKVEDVSLAAIGLFLLAPAMAMIALAIKIDSKGPVFFRQRRHGYNHRVIEVLKFRTMTVCEDGDTVTQATKNDKRVTRVGWFLRRTSLDELPQLWNVLRGDMSIVGPRPHAIAHNSYYGGFIENYANRHRVKPGITGWAQVHGFRGETGDPKMMEQRVHYDLNYIENWSLWLDIKIIIMTPLFGLFRKGAY